MVVIVATVKIPFVRVSIDVKPTRFDRKNVLLLALANIYTHYNNGVA